MPIVPSSTSRNKRWTILTHRTVLHIDVTQRKCGWNFKWFYIPGLKGTKRLSKQLDRDCPYNKTVLWKSYEKTGELTKYCLNLQQLVKVKNLHSHKKCIISDMLNLSTNRWLNLFICKELVVVVVVERWLSLCWHNRTTTHCLKVSFSITLEP